jgi:hypothetical protein
VPPPAPETSQRLLFIDLARSFAIALALTVHCTIAFHLSTPGLQLTRFATPLFAFVFGVMLEMVYARKAQTRGLAVSATRLARRGAMCYATYVLTVWVGYLRGYTASNDAAWASVFLGQSLFNNILKYYALALPLAIPLLALRLRAGLAAPALLGVAYWLIEPWLATMSWPATGTRMAYLTGLLVAKPDLAAAGLPLFPSIVLIGAGMIVGASIRSTVTSRFLWTSTAIATSGLLVCTLFAARDSVAFVVNGFLSGSFRESAHPAYFMMGMAGSVIVLLSMWAVAPLVARSRDVVQALTLAGRYPLVAFGGGNVLLNLWPDRLRLPEFGVLNVLVFVVSLAAILALADRWMGKDAARSAAVASALPSSG